MACGYSPLIGDTSVLVKSDAVGYYDLLFALCWRVCGVKMQANEMVKETMSVLKNKGMYSVNHEVRSDHPNNQQQPASQRERERVALSLLGLRAADISVST